MSEDNHKYASNIEEIEKHPGYKYKMSRKAHSRSLYIYMENFQELMSLIDSVESPESYFEQGWNELENEKILFLKLHRYFHNYVASVESLVSHTRKYVRNRYTGQAFIEEYEKRVSEDFKDYAPSVVVKDMRNYILHIEIPSSSITTQIRLDGTPPTIKLEFDTRELLIWKKWSSLGKSYLSNSGEKLWLKELLVAYHNNVHDFYIWFDQSLDELHKVELIELERLMGQFND